MGSLDPAADDRAVKMTVAALLHRVFFQHGQNLGALVALIEGRIVQKAEDGPPFRRSQRRLQAPHLPVEHLGVVGLLLLLQIQTPGAAQALVTF